jgi:hypothetical protein
MPLQGCESLKGCHTKLRQAKSIVDLGEEPLVVFKYFPILFQYLINITRNPTLQRKRMEIATFLLIAAGICSERLLDSCLALLKRYRKATGSA